MAMASGSHRRLGSGDNHPMDPCSRTCHQLPSPSNPELALPLTTASPIPTAKSASTDSGSASEGKDALPSPEAPNRFRPPPLLVAVLGLFSYIVILTFGYCRDLARRFGLERNPLAQEDPRQRHFVPLYSDFAALYTANVYRPIRDCFNRPVCSNPGATMRLAHRVSRDYCWTFKRTGQEVEVLNFGSYNYLGFAERKGLCATAAKAAVRRHGISAGDPRHQVESSLLVLSLLLNRLTQVGVSSLQEELETVVAEFLGTEAAVCFPMGFATNSTTLPSLLGKGCLVLSDELNHSSLITGCKLSAATKRVFRHDDMADLERKLRFSFKHLLPSEAEEQQIRSPKSFHFPESKCFSGKRLVRELLNFNFISAMRSATLDLNIQQLQFLGTSIWLSFSWLFVHHNVRGLLNI